MQHDEFLRVDFEHMLKWFYEQIAVLEEDENHLLEKMGASTDKDEILYLDYRLDLIERQRDELIKSQALRMYSTVIEYKHTL